jgi:hypothetical protein
MNALFLEDIGLYTNKTNALNSVEKATDTSLAPPLILQPTAKPAAILPVNGIPTFDKTVV